MCIIQADNKGETMEKDLALSCIRTGTDHDLADAMALAACLLDETSANMDFVSRQFSFDLLVAVLMSTAYGTRDKTLAEVLLYLVDPTWDSPRQILLSFSQEREAWKQPSASKWRKGLTGKLEMVNDDAVAPQIKRCYMGLYAQTSGICPISRHRQQRAEFLTLASQHTRPRFSASEHLLTVLAQRAARAKMSVKGLAGDPQFFA
jgi:hypothetical protein